MRKRVVLLLALCLLLFLSACHPEDGTGIHTITLGGSIGRTVVTVDMDSDTLTLDGVSYSYTREDDLLVIRFTDNICMKSSRDDGTVWNGEYSSDFEDYRFLGGTLAKAYWLAYNDQAGPQWEFHPLRFLLGLAFIGWGVWCRRDPEAVFAAQHWRYNNLEPSEDGLEMIRLEAWILWIIGFVLLCGSFG